MSERTYVLGKREAFERKPLSDAESLALWHEAKGKGFKGPEFDRLVESYMALVSFLASRAAEQAPPHANIEVTDLESTGFLRLLEQIPRFNPDLGVPLGAWIATKVPFRLGHAILKEIKAAAGPYGPEGRQGDGLGLVQLSSIVSYRDTEAPTTEFDRAEAAADLARLVEASDLTTREREVIEQRALGLNLAEIGREIGITRERVRQLEKSAVAKMQTTAEKDG
jgi:RNA polymerase sigma factor (sigma-70 family)